MSDADHRLERALDWRLAAPGGIICLIASITAGLAASIAGAIAAICLAIAIAGRLARQKSKGQNERLDGALNNMNQGLCMFGADNCLAVWNRRYVDMYRIDPTRVHVGCTIRDLLDARIAAGTFPFDPARYDTDLRAALREGKTFKLEVELADGRVIAVVNQPMASGGWVATHEDITEHKRAERKLEQTRSFLDTVLENVPSPIMVRDVPDMRYRLINRAAEEHLGVRRATMLGKTAREVMPPEVIDGIEREDRRLLESGQTTHREEHTVLTPANGVRIVTSTRHLVKGPDGTPRYIITMVRDLTERRRHEERIAHLSHHDPLTNLPNRSAFNERIAAGAKLANAADESFAVLSIDLDRFNTVNDVFGHAVGDALLREVAMRMQTAAQGAFVARTGGDGFTAISPVGPQPATAEVLARRLTDALSGDIVVNGHSLRVGLTIGIALFPQDGIDEAAVVANADAALYRAKSEARGSIRFFEMSMDQQLRDKRALQQDLGTALAGDEFELHYQPQARINGEIIGFEALARWHHPRHGMVPPDTFIPLAEESGNIIALGEWVLRKACHEAASWPRPLQIAVNLSPVQFQHGDLPSMVHQVLLDTGLAPGRLELEITEGVLIGDFDRVVGILRRLKNLGVRIAMDDFGTGYSSLSYLQSFPFDKIKIDKAFIVDLDDNEHSATIVRAVIALGHGLSLPVMAEGVETAEQLAFLARESCDEIQGYYIGWPKPIADYAGLVGRAPFGRRGKRRFIAIAS